MLERDALEKALVLQEPVTQAHAIDVELAVPGTALFRLSALEVGRLASRAEEVLGLIPMLECVFFRQESVSFEDDVVRL